MLNCSSCLAPERYQYGPGTKPDLTLLDRGNWISLERRERCGA